MRGYTNGVPMYATSLRPVGAPAYTKVRCSALAMQTISVMGTKREDVTTACVESNASSAAKTYCTAARAIGLSVPRVHSNCTTRAL
jgi:hypothetical protein